MGLKTFLRDWLEVDQVETALHTAKKLVIDQDTLRKEIADALMVVFSGKRTLDNYDLWTHYLEDHGNRFEITLRKITGEQAESAARSLVESRIGGEYFIDELVARLRRKQLGA